jgi:hypothetical protein
MHRSSSVARGLLYNYEMDFLEEIVVDSPLLRIVSLERTMHVRHRGYRHQLCIGLVGWYVVTELN